MVLIVRDTNVLSGGDNIREGTMGWNLGQGWGRGGNPNWRGWNPSWSRGGRSIGRRRNGDSTDAVLTKMGGREG